MVNWLEKAGRMIAFQGLPARICWLGYGQREIREVLNKLDHSLAEKEQLKQALKFLGKK